MKTVDIIIPIYNEEESAPNVIKEIKNTFNDSNFKFKITVVDDGSTDNSYDKIKDLCHNVIRNKVNKGYGAAIKKAIRHTDGDLIVIIDADGTYPPGAIPKLLEKLDDFDMIVGARTGKDVKIPFLRKPAKFIFSKLANYLSEYKIPDLNSGLRAFTRKSVEQYLHLIPNGYSLTMTVTLAYLCDGLDVEYIPIDYHKRIGKSKIKPLRDTKNFIFTILRTIMYFNPLKICLPLSLILASLSLGVLIYTAKYLDRIMDGTVAVLAIASIQLIVIGLLADMITKRSK
jgi:glycosyltransferase involved in cell wall biosynthesis